MDKHECVCGAMLKDAGMSEEHLEVLKLSGLVHEGKLADTAKLRE